MTQLQLTPETWTTRIELADVEGGGTRVTMTLTLEPVGGGRVSRWLQQRAREGSWSGAPWTTNWPRCPAHVAALSR